MPKQKKSTATSAFGVNGRVNHDSARFYNSRMYKELATPIVPVEEKVNALPLDLENRILHASAEQMTAIPNACVHLMITSPPYNAAKEYDEDLSLEEYLSLLERVFRETYRVLVPGGRACINVANLGRKPYLPLSAYISRLMTDIGFLMRGEIIWDKGSSAAGSTAWGSWQSASNPTLRDVHEYVLIFSKGNYKRQVGKKEKSVKKSTITKEQFLEWTKTVWRFGAESAKRVGHPAPFPEELPFRLIQLYSFETDVVLDPFMGSGTTAIAALRSNRKFCGYETVEQYIELANRRIARFEKK